MRPQDPIKRFIRRYLTRSVLGVSVGLAGLGAAAANQPPDQPADTGAGDQSAAPSFADRLSRIRAAASEINRDEPSFDLAQISNFGSFSNYQGDGAEDPIIVARKTDK